MGDLDNYARALDNIVYTLESVVDRVERVGEPAYTGYGLSLTCQWLRASIAELTKIAQELSP